MTRLVQQFRTCASQLLCILLVGTVPTCVRGAYAASVEIVLGEDSATYAETARLITDDLSGRVAVSTVSSAGIARGTRRANANLVITLGSRALHADLDSERIAPTIAALLPRQTFDQALKSAPLASRSRALTAVFLDQPPERQLNLIRLLTPERTRVGILASPALDDSVRLLESAAREQRLSIRRETLDQPSKLHAALLHLLPETDVILALPDALVFNSSTVPNILLTTYRAQQPLFGFSASYVRSGAIAAVYSTPRQIARQVAELALRVLAGATLPPPRYPSAFSVGINTMVANSLGIALDSEQDISRRLQSMEREP